MTMFYMTECSSITKSGLINSIIYKLIGKGILPAFLVFNTHYMQTERDKVMGTLEYLP